MQALPTPQLPLPATDGGVAKGNPPAGGLVADAGDAGNQTPFQEVLAGQLRDQAASDAQAFAGAAAPLLIDAGASAEPAAEVTDFAALSTLLRQFSGGEGPLAAPLPVANMVRADGPVESAVEAPEFLPGRSARLRGVELGAANLAAAGKGLPVTDELPALMEGVAGEARPGEFRLSADFAARAEIALNSQPVAVRQVAQPASLPVAPQVGSAGWDAAVGQRVVWMVGQHQQTADLQLNPPHLGPLEVRLSISDNQASLAFTSAHTPVREALEAAIPRLREMLSENGIALGNFSVGAEPFRQQAGDQRGDGQQRSTSFAGEPSGPIELTTSLPGGVRAAGLGLLDVFA